MAEPKTPEGSRWGNALAQAPDPNELKKRALVAAAGRAFGVKGFHNTTLDDVAKALSVTKPALYRYVRSKHEILFECHRMAVGMAEEALAEAVDRGTAPLETIRGFTEGYIQRMTSELGTCVVLTEYYSMTPEHNTQIQQRRRHLDSALRALVQQCVDTGAIAPCDPKLAVFFFMGAINNINRWYTEAGNTSGPAIASAFASFVVEGLKPKNPGSEARADSCPASEPAPTAP